MPLVPPVLDPAPDHLESAELRNANLVYRAGLPKVAEAAAEIANLCDVEGATDKELAVLLDKLKVALKRAGYREKGIDA